MDVHSHPARELCAQERAALALWLLQQRPHTTAELARRVELSTDGARRMLLKMARVVPLARTGARWSVISAPNGQTVRPVDVK